MLNIPEMVEHCSYSNILQTVVERLGGEKVLRLDYDADWQGYVDIDVLLKDGRVFSFYYSYGSCEYCDDWMYRELSDEEIAKEMIQGATIFDNLDQYKKWREKVEEER